MGWFLGKKKTKRRTRQSPAAWSPRPWEPRRTLGRLKLVLIAAAAVGVGFGWVHGQRYLKAYTARGMATGVDASRVELVDAPSWMNPIVYQELCQSVADQVYQDPFDHDGLERAVLVLSVSPWVERVNRVRRSSDGRLLVEAVYRAPVAVVEGRDGYHLVSRDGVRLPGLYLRGQLAELGLPVVVGVAQAPAQAGQVWPGGDLRAGLDLVHLLNGQPYVKQISCVDVSGRDAQGRIRLLLRTAQGMVRWGLPPGMEQVIEPDAQTKLSRLNEVYRQRGVIDAGGKVVDVYGATVFVRQPYDSDTRLGAGYTFSR